MWLISNVLMKKFKTLYFFSPPIEYNETLDLHRDVYLNYTSLVFDVYAIDNGTIPRGTSATVNITVSNTCILDVLFTPTNYNILVDNTTGGLNFIVPGYWVYDFRKYSHLNFQHVQKANKLLYISRKLLAFCSEQVQKV